MLQWRNMVNYVAETTTGRFAVRGTRIGVFELRASGMAACDLSVRVAGDALCLCAWVDWRSDQRSAD